MKDLFELIWDTNERAWSGMFCVERMMRSWLEVEVAKRAFDLCGPEILG